MYQNITFPSLLTTNMDKQKDRNNQRLYPVQVVATLKFIWNSKMKKKDVKGGLHTSALPPYVQVLIPGVQTDSGSSVFNNPLKNREGGQVNIWEQYRV